MPFIRLNYNVANRASGKKVWLFMVLSIMVLQASIAQSRKNLWVDSTFQTLSFEAKLGQLIFMPVDVRGGAAEQQKIETLIQTYGIGGIVITSGGPGVVSQFTRQLQKRSGVPLFVGLNAEEGLGSTLDSAVVFPPTIMLGALTNDSLVYHFGREVGRQMRSIGANLAFAPTSDLSTTYQTDEMIAHTFGDNPQRVAALATQYMKGLQHEGIMTVAKHYPNYALRVQGYYKGAPIMQMVQGEQQSLYPLQQLMQNGCPGIFASYRHNPIFPNRKTIIAKKYKIVPETLPTLYTADYLKKNLGYDGLVFSYVPDVKIVQKKYRAGDSETYALLAGNDILLFPGNLSAAIRKLRKQIKKDPALAVQLDSRVKKVLAAKYDAGLTSANSSAQGNGFEAFNTLEDIFLLNSLYENSVTIIKDEQNYLPVKSLDNTSFASLSIGAQRENTFTQYLDKYASFDHYELTSSTADINELKEALTRYDVIMVSIFQGSQEVKDAYQRLLQELTSKQVIIANLGSVSQLAELNAPVLIQGYVDNEILRRLIPQMIFGALPVQGKLPLTVNERLKEGMQVTVHNPDRLSFALIPEEAGMDSRTLERIERVVQEAIDTQATPGCQVMVVKSGKVVYDRSFGWQTYDKKLPVTPETIYDLASMTKVLGTLQAVMFLHDRGLIDINKKLSVYLPELRNTNKKDIIIKDILTHQAGLVPFVPLWNNTVNEKNGKNTKEFFLPQYYSNVASDHYPLQVAPDLFASPVLIDSLWKWTFESKMQDRPARTPYAFRYSDISFWLLHRLVEHMINQPLDEFLMQNLYEPIGASTTGFNPLSRFSASQIPPTEFDKIFRKTMVHGTVHDERAAMMGGVAGHAGLFSNAYDVAKLGQMLLQGGIYGGHRYLKQETIDLFIRKQFETSRRGLGWDKPIQSDWTSPTSLYASPMTYGHTGFTGTCIWIDPEFDLVYVFLSNRVYPDRSTKLINANIRSRIQDIIYQSIFNFCPYPNPNLWSRSR